MAITLDGTNGVTASSPATIKASAYLDAAGGNTATINGMTPVGTDATQTLTNKTIQGGAITRATAIASTSGTTIDFTGIPSWAKRITVMFSGVSTSGASTKLVQIGSGSFTTSGYSGGGAVITNTAVGGAGITNGFSLGNSGAAADVVSGNMVIQNITGNTWVASFSGGGSNVNFALVSGGSLSLGGVLDRIRITTSNGTDTFDAGTVNIMYEG